MFSPRSLLITLVNISLLSATATAGHGSRNRLSNEIEKRAYDGSRFTFYDDGQNACGWYDRPDEWVVALPTWMFENGAHCGQTIGLWYNNKQVNARVTDMCPGCEGTGLDLSRALFEQLAPLDQGVIYGSWWFA